MMRLAIFLMGAMLAAAQNRPPVLVELFTSEGCSSCPPADQLLMRLPRAFSDIEVIPLSEHVDYWNHLGWTDRFSSPLFSARQQDYGRIFHLENVYTPEMVVNGEAEFNGSDWMRARDAILKAAREPRATLVISMGDVAHLQVSDVPQGVRNVDLFLAITEANLETVPRGGENGGRTLRHTGVVRNLTSVGHFDAKKSGSYSADARISINPKWSRENVRLVWFAQDRATRKIIGAATARP
ncbi:MAG TPA: DUF1223 domain-containing protein [Bryobacteraceae bacterium]|nr:DUF1223 domain-containing protein [Bryobacteraceae bacterium]